MCSWIDDYLIVGNKKDVIKAKSEFSEAFDCEDDGEMKEQVGCKIIKDWNENSMTIAQPVLLQNLDDEFNLPGAKPVTPLPAGIVHEKRKEKKRN